MYTCLICKKEFDNSRKYGGHLSRHSKEDRDSIGIKRSLYDSNIILDHPIPCKFCGRLSKNKNSLKQHELRCFKNPNRDLTKIGFFKYNSDKLIHNSNGIYRCQYCKKEFKNSYVFGGHIVTCLENPNHHRNEISLLSKSNKGKIDSNRKCQKCMLPGDVLFNGRYCSKCKLLYYHSYLVSCKFMFNVYDYPDYFDLDLIKRYGWFSPPNRGNNIHGVSRDHILSINYGFKNNIDPFIMRHPANCQIIIQCDNSKKHKKCNISLNELLIKIEQFNIKYPSYLENL